MLEFPVIMFQTPRDFSEWLEINHSAAGLWIQIAKKGSGQKSVTYDEALDVALCYGWIDGLKKKYDEKSWIQRFTPRKPKSNWSKINREKVERFIALGLMKPSGFLTIENAKKHGTWDVAYDSFTSMNIPDDFKLELARNPIAEDFFNSLNSTNRFSVLYRIQVSKSPEKRALKIAQLIDMLINQQKFHP
jgi:uncharacterized protein YdeI (YjbR/CyaY-like superfamily)